MWRDHATLRVFRMRDSISSAISVETCSRCGKSTHVRRVSKAYEYLCDPCGILILDMTAAQFVQDLNTWDNLTIVSMAALRSCLEHRRKLVLSTRLTCAFGNPWGEHGCGPCPCCESASDRICPTHGVVHVLESKQV